MRENIDAGQVRSRLTELLGKVGDGDTFVVTKYGKPIAQLGPLDVAVTTREPIQPQTARPVGPQIRKDQDLETTRQANRSRQQRVDDLLRGSRRKG